MRLFDLETSRMVLEEEANLKRLGYRADEIKAWIGIESATRGYPPSQPGGYRRSNRRRAAERCGGPLGAAIGAGIGFAAGIVRLFVKGAQEKAREKIKATYGVDISYKGLLKQIVDIAKRASAATSTWRSAPSRSGTSCSCTR